MFYHSFSPVHFFSAAFNRTFCIFSNTSETAIRTAGRALRSILTNVARNGISVFEVHCEAVEDLASDVDLVAAMWNQGR